MLVLLRMKGKYKINILSTGLEREYIEIVKEYKLSDRV